VARCHDDASLARLAGELHTTIDMLRRLIGQAGIHRASAKVRSARSRRLATDERLTERAAQLGFASLQAYLGNRVTDLAWSLRQIADELGMDRGTVRDRLNRCRLRRSRQPSQHRPGRRRDAVGARPAGGATPPTRHRWPSRASTEQATAAAAEGVGCINAFIQFTSCSHKVGTSVRSPE
jgi:hypothetical protein